MPRWALATCFLLIAAAGSGSYILLGWLFTVMLHRSGPMAVSLALLIVLGSAVYVAVVGFLLDSLIVGAVFFGCGALGFPAGFGLVALYSSHSTGLQALAIIGTGVLMGALMIFIRGYMLSGVEEELYAWWALAGYLGAEGGAFVSADLIHHWSWWRVALILAAGFIVIAYRAFSTEFSTDTAYLPH